MGEKSSHSWAGAVLAGRPGAGGVPGADLGAPRAARARPSGQSDADPRAGHRSPIVIGVAIGLILILAGAYVALEPGVPWSLPVFALGFGLVFDADPGQPAVSPLQPDPAPDDRRLRLVHGPVAAGRILVVGQCPGAPIRDGRWT